MFSKNFWFIVSANLLMALKNTLKRKSSDTDKWMQPLAIDTHPVWYWWKHIWHWTHWKHQSPHTPEHSRWQSVQWHRIYSITHQKNYTIVKKFLHLCWKSQTIEFCFLCCTQLCIPEKREQFFQAQCYLLPNPARSQGWHLLLSGVWQLKQLLCSHH